MTEVSRGRLIRIITTTALIGACWGEHSTTKTGAEAEAFEAAPRKMQVFSLFPTGAQRATSVNVQVLGANLDGIDRVETDCKGLQTRVLSSSYLAAYVQFTVTSEAAAGQCRVRLFSSIGVSNLQVFRIGELPEQGELEPNDSPESAQHLKVPSVVDGRLYPDEDVDFYSIDAKAGEQITAEIFAARNGSGLNSEMYLLDVSGKRIAVGINEEGPDPVIRYRFQSDGEYRLAIRGTYGVLNISFPTGHPAYSYQLRITGSVPRLQVVRPFSVTAEQTSAIRMSGDGLSSVDSLFFSDSQLKAAIVERSPDEIVAKVSASADSVGIHKMWAVAGPIRSASVNLLVTAKPDRTIAEPHHSIERAVELTLADAVAGQISHPGDLDFYAFKAPEESLYVWELQAGEFPSLLDPKVELLDEAGGVIQSATGGPDSDLKIERKLKQGEKVNISVAQSVLNYSGAGYNYRLLVRKARPTFTISPGARQPAPKQLSGNDRVYLARGAEFALPLKIQWQEGFDATDAPIRVEAEGLPEGITAVPLEVTPKDGKRDKEKSPLVASKDLVLRASGDAPLGSARIRIRGSAHRPDGDLKVYETVRVNAGGSYVLSVSGGSPQQIDCRYLNVVDPVRYELRPEIGDERYPTRYTLRPGSKKPLLITVLTKEAQLPEMRFEAENLPRGVRISAVEFIPDKKQYRLTMEASADAERGWRPMVIFIAHAKPQDSVLTTPYFGLAVQ